MNKNEFVSFIAAENNISKTDAERALNMIVDSIMQAAQKGEGVSLIGFGAFDIKARPAREGRNPKTGEKMNISAYNQPVFKAGAKLKAACN